MIEKVVFRDTYFSDIVADDKSPDELARLLLQNAAGRKVSMDKYNDREINKCARELIIEGYLRGTVFDSYRCCWSKTTRKGNFLLKILEQEDNLIPVF